MKKAGQLALTICSDFAKTNPKSKMLIAAGNGGGEGYTAKKWGTEVRIQADSPLAAAYGAAQMTVAIKSGHFADFSGVRYPKFPLRPLWLSCDCEVEVSAGCYLWLPQILCHPQNIDLCCRRVVELGYNGLIFSSLKEKTAVRQLVTLDMPALSEQIRDYGIKIIAEPRWDHLNPGAFFKEFAKFTYLDAIFWKARLYDDPFPSRNATEPEMALAEVKILEAALPKNLALIYYLPVVDFAKAKRQSLWLPAFCDDVCEKTVIAFPAISGSPYWDHLPWHPLWEALRRAPDESATAFLPIVNSGGVEQGEGLWPGLNTDLVAAISARCFRHRFAGIAALAACLPERGSFLDCNLWVSGHVLWYNISPELLAESWFSAFRKDLEFDCFSALFREVKKISTQLGEMRFLLNSQKKIEPEGAKMLAESTFAKIERLDFLTPPHSQQTQQTRPPIQAYMRYFVRDAKRMVCYFLQSARLPMVGLLKEDDLGPAFWTKISSSSGAATPFTAAPEVFLNQLPDCGESGSLQQQIFLETCLLTD